MRVRACGRPGVSAGEEGTVRAAGGRGPSTLPPSVPPRPTQLAASPERVPGSGLRLDREPGLPGEGGHPRWVPQLPSTHCIRPAHAGASLVPICPQEETGARRPRRWWWGGVSCCLRSQHPPPGRALHSALLGALGGTRWAGGRGRNIPPRVPTGPGGRRQLLAPPPFRRAILAGWRTQAGIAGASTWPRARPVCEPKPWPLTLVRSREPVRFPGPAPQTCQRLRKTLGAALAPGRRPPRWAGRAAGGARGPS